MMTDNPTKDRIIIILLAALFFMPFLGAVHLFDWDEINFAEIAREMLITGDYLRPQIDYLTFTEKPPGFMWLQAISMNLFGVGEYAARFPNTIAGLITLVFIYNIGLKIYNRTFAWIWVMAYFGSVLPHLYFRSGIIDPWFNLFIFGGIYYLILYYWKKSRMPDVELNHSKWTYLVIAGVMTGLGIMVKGPVAYLITSLTLGVYWVLNRFRFFITPLDFISYSLVVLLTASLWFGVVTVAYGPDFAIEFTVRQWELFSQQDAGHGGFPGYHFIVLLIGVFPASIFMLRSFGYLPVKYSHRMDMRKWMMVLFWVVLILFTIVSTKIVHYSSLAYYPETFLAAMVIYYLKTKEIAYKTWMTAGIVFISILFGLALIALPWVGMNVDIIKPLFKADPFAMANLDADVPWTGFESVSGVIFILAGVFGAYYFSKKKVAEGVIALFGGTAIFIFITLALVITKIEMITQNAAIEFYVSKQDCNCYVMPVNYKSYAHLFYTRVKPGGDPRRHNTGWLMNGNIDRDTFFVAKITGISELEKNPEIKMLYEKNGFTFWVRKKKVSD